MVGIIFSITLSCSKIEYLINKVNENLILTEVQKKEIIFVLGDTFSTCKTGIFSNGKPRSD